MLTIKIANLLGQPLGAQENYKIEDTEALFDKADFKLKDSVKCDVNLIHIEGGVTVVITDLRTRLEFTCSRCLKEFQYAVKIPQAERQFLFKISKESQNENFLIDKNKLEVDLKEMIRQEIILHFPIIPLCSKSCKGLCSKCGVDLSKKKCSCEKKADETCKPFKDLRKLVDNPPGS